MQHLLLYLRLLTHFSDCIRSLVPGFSIFGPDGGQDAERAALHPRDLRVTARYSAWSDRYTVRDHLLYLQADS